MMLPGMFDGSARCTMGYYNTFCVIAIVFEAFLGTEFLANSQLDKDPFSGRKRGSKSNSIKNIMLFLFRDET